MTIYIFIFTERWWYWRGGFARAQKIVSAHRLLQSGPFQTRRATEDVQEGKDPDGVCDGVRKPHREGDWGDHESVAEQPFQRQLWYSEVQCYIHVMVFTQAGLSFTSMYWPWANPLVLGLRCGPRFLNKCQPKKTSWCLCGRLQKFCSNLDIFCDVFLKNPGGTPEIKVLVIYCLTITKMEQRGTFANITLNITPVFGSSPEIKVTYRK